MVGAGPHPDQGAATGSVEGQPQPEQLLPLPAGGQGQVVGAGPHPDQGAATGSVEGQPEPEQLVRGARSSGWCGASFRPGSSHR